MLTGEYLCSGTLDHKENAWLTAKVVWIHFRTLKSRELDTKEDLVYGVLIVLRTKT